MADLPLPPRYFARKRALDRIGAAVLMIPALPIMAVLALLVRLTSRGPVIYRQLRIGQRGRKFQMYKFRTMRHDAEAASGPVWSQPADPRVTWLGRLLRRFHIDELPQLINVLKGEMSLVGPRPERPEFIEILASQVTGYVKRLAVPPGVTGLAQLNLPPDSDLDSVRRKLALDLEYVEQAGPFLDLRLFLGTFLRVFKLPESLVLRLLGLQRAVTIAASGPHGANGSGGKGHAPVALPYVAAPPHVATPGKETVAALGDDTVTCRGGNGHTRKAK